jgi:gas vesicle protein
MSENNGYNIFKGFVLGSIFGAVIGLLIAPKSGRELRSEILEESDELLDKAKAELEKIKNEVSDLRQRISKSMGKGKMSFDEAQTMEERDFEAQVNSMEEEIPQPKKSKKA